MSYTLRQVHPLLTQPELALFELSRVPAIKGLTVRQLDGKVIRARALRDKYRDLYRRQTVQTRERPAGQRKATGGDNERTSVKADILAEVLERFEAQHAKLSAAPAKAATPAKKAAAAKKPRAAGQGADLPMRAGATSSRQLARKKQAAADEAAAVVASGQTAAKKAPAAAKKAAAAPAATPAKAKPKSSKGAATADVEGLVKAVRGATRAKAKASAPAYVAPGKRAPSVRAASGANALAQGKASTDVPAMALRANPLKAKPVNKKIHAAQRAQHARHQAKRDAG